MSSKILISSNDRGDNGGDSNEDHITKKVSFKETIEDTVKNMVVDLSLNIMGDILRSNVNVIPTIDFSDRIKKWLVKDMETTVVVKLLG
ncbi:hypothetical protein Goshw_029762 [Gossypium schwendimanii]|uniref:Uncharacterized protein n=1 Tax=Gossypium schwendimanii TaxID=34291 RepID=A0A7J9KNZ4_GOSSC|nr:hypothetical protein [Gossypium schwendimanii]